MPILTTWHPNFSVGSESMDRQHQRLLKLCNELGESISQPVGELGKDFHEVLHELAEYSRTHFEAEEALLGKYGYTKLSEQRDEHLQYCKDIAEAAFAASTMGVTNMITLQRFLARWWTDHIQIKDMEYREFLIANRSA